MANKSGIKRFDQLELFRPPPKCPQWESLPKDVQTEVRERVVQMLRIHVEAKVKENRREVRHD